jgi:hypothetical protein
MKVIIQDICSKEYLSEDGQWVSARAQARDFYTLLRAYHFGCKKASGRFQVLLYCEEDDYSSCIIEGIGSADADTFTPPVAAQPEPVHFARRNEKPVRAVWARTERFDWIGNPLN